eukprot:6381807-Lingulodinium_polyedra.AAC.1
MSRCVEKYAAPKLVLGMMRAVVSRASGAVMRDVESARMESRGPGHQEPAPTAGDVHGNLHR